MVFSRAQVDDYNPLPNAATYKRISLSKFTEKSFSTATPDYNSCLGCSATCLCADPAALFQPMRLNKPIASAANHSHQMKYPTPDAMRAVASKYSLLDQLGEFC
jgi:hypothetical protein